MTHNLPFPLEGPLDLSTSLASSFSLFAAENKRLQNDKTTLQYFSTTTKITTQDPKQGIAKNEDKDTARTSTFSSFSLSTGNVVEE